MAARDSRILASIEYVVASAGVYTQTAQASVEYVVTSVGVDRQTAQASVEYQRARVANKTYVIPVTAIQWINIVFDVQVDTLGRNPVVYDISVVVDEARLGFGKNVSEFQSATDQLLPFQIGKGLTDQPASSDAYAFDLSRELQDAAIPVDAYAASFEKGTILETQQTEDTYALGFTPEPKRDFVSNTEGPNSNQTYVDLTYFAETYALEYYPKLDFGKSVSDLLSATEGQIYVSVDKALDDPIGTSEQLGFDISTGRADSAGATDVYAGEFITSRAEAVIFADSSVKSTTKANIDGAATGDSGTLYMTDYVDITYFAEYYVGTVVDF